MEASFETIKDVALKESQDVTQTKHCNKCGRDLPVRMFSKNSHNKDGLQCYCKECQSLANKRINDAKRERIKSLAETPKNTDGKPMLKVYSNPDLARFTPRQLMEELKARGYRWDYMLEPQRKIMFEKI